MTAPLYEVALVGDPESDLLLRILFELDVACAAAALEYDREYRVSINPTRFQPSERSASVLVLLGGPATSALNVTGLVDVSNVLILPIASSSDSVNEQIPLPLRHLNCLFAGDDPTRIVSAILEALGLLPSQRRIFLSYRRTEARGAALQLFNELSGRHFDVFLDTHGIPPGVDFQSGLWHRLCDSDVLVMLDTPNYFESRWTEAEFGRALSKGIAVLRVGWPDSTPSRRTETASRVELVANEVDGSTGELSTGAVERIARQLEQVRCLGHATRQLSIIGNIRAAVEKVQGEVEAIGLHRTLHIKLANGTALIAQVSTGVPTAMMLQAAVGRAKGKQAALIYDHIGLLPEWQGHLDWLGDHVKTARWVKLAEAAWVFGGWES